MTGPEHYREAERLLTVAKSGAQTEGSREDVVARAQVHATLAHAAATAVGAEAKDSWVRVAWKAFKFSD